MNLYEALEAGDLDRLKTLDLDVRAKGGPRNWEPLLYVCFSPNANPKSPHAARMVETARMLLQRGADPNASYIDEHWPDWPLPCLYGATGVNNNPALALVLLEAGANPNDQESLYHSTEHPDLDCVRLLLKHGAVPKGTNSLNHMLDREDLDGLELLLNAGADPNARNVEGETSLHWAVWRGRSAASIERLLDAGAAIDVESKDGRTAYAVAVLTDQTGIAQLLAQRGAKANVPPVKPTEAGLIPKLASNHFTSAVRTLLDAGFPVDARGSTGETALHWACWKGYPDLAKLLLERGAPLTVKDTEYDATPAGWLEHGSRNCGSRDGRGGGDYAGVERLLRAQETDGRSGRA